MKPTTIGLVLLCIAGAVGLTLTGCGPAAAEQLHGGLNAATDYADPLYAATVAECDAQEEDVLASHAPDDGEAAYAALAQVRARCDVALASWEAVRETQRTLRATADAMEDGRATASDLLRSLDELQGAYRAAHELYLSIRAARGTP